MCLSRNHPEPRRDDSLGAKDSYFGNWVKAAFFPATGGGETDLHSLNPRNDFRRFPGSLGVEKSSSLPRCKR